MIGQRTPGHTLAEARAFEERINRRYVDHIARAGWGYYGVYQVEGLVPGAFGEILSYGGDDLEEALRRDKENDREPTGCSSSTRRQRIHRRASTSYRTTRRACRRRSRTATRSSSTPS